MPDRPGGAIPAGPVFFRDSGRGQSAFQVQRSCHRAGEAGIGERLRSDEVLRETTKLLPAPPMDHSQASHQEGIDGIGVKRGFRVARAPSPDVRVGHPWPPLTRCRLRFAIHGFAGRQRRLSEHGRPLARGVERCAFITAVSCCRHGAKQFTVRSSFAPSRRFGRLAAGPRAQGPPDLGGHVVADRADRPIHHRRADEATVITPRGDRGERSRRRA